MINDFFNSNQAEEFIFREVLIVVVVVLICIVVICVIAYVIRYENFVSHLK